MDTLKNQKGFTLVEALIATAILSIGIITLVTMQTTTVKGNAKASGITTAATLAQDKIEQFVAADYDDIESDAEPSPDGHYQLAWTVNETVLASVPANPLKEIQITVTRNDFGLQRAVSFTYYKQKIF